MWHIWGSEIAGSGAEDSIILKYILISILLRCVVNYASYQYDKTRIFFEQGNEPSVLMIKR
jgi:hypothetical protein